MAIEGNEIVRRYLDSLADGFSCHQEEGAKELLVGTPYLYPNDDCICLYMEELADDQVKVSDGGEAASLNLWKAGFDIFHSPWAISRAREIARDNMAEFELGDLSRTGPAEELGEIMLSVIQAALGVAHLQYVNPRLATNFPRLERLDTDTFPDKLDSFISEITSDYAPSAKLTGASGQVYYVHYQINNVAGHPAYLHTLNIRRPDRAKPAVDRIYRLWSDCSHVLSNRKKITLLNDDHFRWKDSHVNLLRSVSTVVNWSERDKLTELVGSQPTL